MGRRFTALSNQTGGADGLPIEVQFGGRLGDEPKLIHLAAQLEQAHPWTNRRASLD